MFLMITDQIFSYSSTYDPSHGHARALEASINRLPDYWSSPSVLAADNRRRFQDPEHRPLVSPGMLHVDFPAGIVLRKQLYSGKSEPLDDDDDDDDVWRLAVSIRPVYRYWINVTHQMVWKALFTSKWWQKIHENYVIQQEIEIEISHTLAIRPKMLYIIQLT